MLPIPPLNISAPSSAESSASSSATGQSGTGEFNVYGGANKALGYGLLFAGAALAVWFMLKKGKGNGAS